LTLTAGTHRAEFLLGEFSVGVLVELLQGLGSLSDFNGIDHAVLVGVECFDEWAEDALTTLASAQGSRATALTAWPSAAAGRWLWSFWSFLSECQDRECAESQRDENTWLFHDRVLVRLRFTVKSVGSVALEVKPWVR